MDLVSVFGTIRHLQYTILLSLLADLFSASRSVALTYIWDVNMMDFPSELFLIITSQIKRRATGSKPDVGSSRNSKGASPINARAVLNLRLLPPL